MKTLPASMVITTYNRSHLLDHSLARFSDHRDAPTAPEQIIVVDDGGDDDCDRICELHAARGLNIEYVWHRHPGETNCCEARNIGLKLARYEALITSEPEVMFLTNVVAQLLDAREEWLMPKTDRVHDAMPLFYGWCHHESEDGSVRRWKFPYVMLYPRSALFEIGGWDQSLPKNWGWDDLDVFNRLEYLGHKQELVDECEYRHQWHPSRIEPAVENEAYVRGKELPRDLIANGHEWGVVRP